MDEYGLEELTERVAAALDARGVTAANGRMRERPDARTVRYYTTLGLMDPPLNHRGRVAHYGRRHLLQLVAIKLLQSAGATLAELQRTVTGLPNEELERIAEKGAGGADAQGTGATSPAPAGARRLERAARRPAAGPRSFWSASPAAATSDAPSASGPRVPAQPQFGTAVMPAGPGLGVRHIPLGAAATLLMSIGPGGELAALEAAAQELQQAIDRIRGTIPPQGDQQ